MEKYKIGGKIILENNLSYRILDILKFKGEDYLFCCTETKPIEPTVLLCKEINGEIYVSVEEDQEILVEILKLVVHN